MIEKEEKTALDEAKENNSLECNHENCQCKNKKEEHKKEKHLEKENKELQEELEVKSKPEIVAIRELRKPISWYTKGLKDSSEFRDKINKIDELPKLKEEIETYFKYLEKEEKKSGTNY